jgi:hypothetical protein
MFKETTGRKVDKLWKLYCANLKGENGPDESSA